MNLNSITPLACIIVDDNQRCIDHLTANINALSYLKVKKTFTDPITAFKQLPAFPEVAIIFLDVEMPQMSGVELAARISNANTDIVFVSAHSRYAVEAFDVHASAYLLKPYSFARFETVIRNLVERRIAKQVPPQYIFIRNKFDKQSFIKLNIGDIVAAESDQNDLIIHTTTDSYTTRLTMKRFEDLLGGHTFIRIHRAYMISVAHIRSVVKNKVVLQNNMVVNVGEFYRKGLLDLVTNSALVI